jgi:hypothetical protein
MKTLYLLSLTLLLCLSTDGIASAPVNDPTVLAQRLESDLAALFADARNQEGDIDSAALARIQAEIDSASGEWMQRGKPAEESSKLAQLRGLLLNAHRFNQLRQQRTPASPPYADLAPALQVRAATSQSVGATCANAMDLRRGTPLASTLAAAGLAGDALWVRVTASASDRTAISTLGSIGDVDIGVFAACADAQPLVANDDFYGLQALALLPSGPRASYLVRIGNRDAARSAQARIEAVLAAGFSGKVSADPPGTASVAGVQVANFSSTTGYYNGTTYTDVSGSYTMFVSGDGIYYARTGSYQQGSLLHEAYPNVPCTNPDYYSLSSCTPGVLAAITVAGNQVTPGIDFDLGLGRALTFRVSNEASGAALTSSSVSLSTAGGNYASGYADGAGRVTFLGLRTGVAYYASFSADGFRREAFDNIPCTSYCQSGQGTPITFETSDPYFREHLVALTPIRQLVVYVRDLPQAPYSATVNVLYPSGQVALSSGAYYSSSIPGWRTAVFAEPPAGTYYLQGGYTDSSFWRIYPDVDCLTDCQSVLSQAQPIVVTAGAQIPAYFIDPRPFPSVEGSVVDQVSGNPVVGASAHMLPLSGGYQQSVAVGSSGLYRFNYARPGSYLIAITSPEHVDVAYPDAPCSGSTYSLVCATATPVTITSTQNTFAFDFSLTPSGRIGGRLTAEGAPIYHTIQMRLRRTDGTTIDGALQTGAGMYSLTDLTPGDYRVVVEDSSYAYGQAYPGIDCAGSNCSSQTLGQLLTVGPTALGNIDFNLHLQRGGKGRVLDATTGQPLAGVVVDMWSSSTSGLSYVRAGISGADGRFVIPAQDTYYSSYRLATSIGNNYINEVYDDVLCPIGPAYVGLCNLAQGVDVPAQHAIDGQGIIFRLQPSGSDIVFANGMED